MSPQELFKLHCKSNATFKQYETFALGYNLGRAGLVPAESQVNNTQITDSMAKYDNAVKAYNRMAESYKKAEDQISTAITLLTTVHNALPDGNHLKVEIATFLTKPE